MIEHKWYIGYTYPRTEKKVDRSIKEMGIESFLPIHKVKRKWSDRIKEVEVPLFFNYLFVKTTRPYLSNLLTIDGLSRFIEFGGEPATIANKQVEAIKKVLKNNFEFEVKSGKFEKGQKIVITEGVFEGVEGILVMEQGKNRYLIEIEEMDQSLSINIPLSYLRSARRLI